MMRRYPTRDEIIQQEDDRRWPKEVTKEQPMSDTLQEREDQMDQHQVNRSGVCEIPGCPCRGWSVQETTTAKKSDNDYQREQFPVGVVVEAIIPISRNRLGDALPVGTQGRVDSHTNDGRAYVFFDGYNEGHTFHEIEKFLRVVQSVKEVSNLPRITYACPNCGKVDEHSDNCPSRPRISEQPAARGGGEGERFGFVVFTGRHKILDYHKPDGQQVATVDDEDSARLIVRALNQHQALVAERERLLEAVKEVAIRSLRYCEQKYGHDDQARLNLEALVESIEQRSTSE